MLGLEVARSCDSTRPSLSAIDGQTRTSMGLLFVILARRWDGRGLRAQLAIAMDCKWEA